MVGLFVAAILASGIVVWAVIFQGVGRERHAIKLSLHSARHLACCDKERVPGGMYELQGFGTHHAYTVYLRIYFGSRPDAVTRAQAQHARDHLELPPAHQA